MTKRTYEELYGSEKAKAIKAKKSKSLKGRTLEDIHGPEKAAEIRAKRKVAATARCTPEWRKNKSITSKGAHKKPGRRKNVIYAFSEEQWKKYKVLEYYPHPEIHCQCPCQGKIKVMPYHELYGIPKYIVGHSLFDTKQTKKWKNSVQNPCRLERKLFAFGITRPGPNWFRTFRDFVLHACQMEGIQYIRARHSIQEFMQEHKYDRKDIVIIINFYEGHNQYELAEEYNVSIDKVKQLVGQIIDDVPGGLPQGPRPTSNNVWNKLELAKYQGYTVQF